MHVHTIKNLLKFSPESVVTPCMTMIKENFQKPALTMVTEQEYNIMLTPDGEAYDQSVYERYVLLFKVLKFVNHFKHQTIFKLEFSILWEWSRQIRNSQCLT